MSTYALIMAAGNGLRLNYETPKQYIQIAGQSILAWTVRKFLSHPSIDGVMVVISPQHVELYKAAINKADVLPYALGGQRRQDSVRLGLKALQKYAPKQVLIHDAARPNVSHALIANVLDKLKVVDAVDVLLDVVDTVKGIEDLCHIDRSTLGLTQTPQGFCYDKIVALHDKFVEQTFTDDIGLAIAGGLNVSYARGERVNFKVTVAEDIKMASAILQSARSVRVGTGFDVHQTKPVEGGKTYIPICGVLLEHSHEVIAHSDGDVGLHALMDAILGAMSLGDIGMHFPPSDIRWKNADSKEMLKIVKSFIDKYGATINNVDITILCERPRITPYREQMIKCLCEILELNENQVSVKATTTEKLGFIGRGEGIAAQAACSVLM